VRGGSAVWGNLISLDKSHFANAKARQIAIRKLKSKNQKPRKDDRDADHCH